jgi:nucleoside 2-deoxyribosyltransferase
LQILIPQPHREPASLRWDQLRESAVAVFDLTGYKRTTILEEAAPVAGIAYELGIACALGRAVVIVANERQELPFDLDEEPIRLRNNDSDLTTLGDGLDHALYGLLRGSAGTSVEKSLRHLREQFSSHPDFHVRLSLDTLDADAARDPIRARLLVGSTLGFLAAEAPHILHPVWPGDYPGPAARRCFHVTAFGPRWADETMTVVSDACRPSIEYVRGDKVLAPDILRSIWDEICRATHIVVDLTGLNANVAFELGIAHTLGRNLLLISQDAQPEQYFRAIAKHRIHHYSLDASPGVTGLKDTLRKFLA